MEAHMELAPKNLKDSELRLIIDVLINRKASKIISSLCDQKSSYFNQIQKKVGGSKTSTQESLKALEKLKIVESKWEIAKFDGKGQPKTRAVKTFKLSKSKEMLIKYYEPLFKKIDQIS